MEYLIIKIPEDLKKKFEQLVKQSIIDWDEFAKDRSRTILSEQTKKGVETLSTKIMELEHAKQIHNTEESIKQIIGSALIQPVPLPTEDRDLFVEEYAKEIMNKVVNVGEKHEVISPISNFKSDIDELEFGDVQIIKLNHQELLEFPILNSNQSILDQFSDNFFLRTSLWIPTKRPEGFHFYKIVYGRFKKILTELRLYKDGDLFNFEDLFFRKITLGSGAGSALIKEEGSLIDFEFSSEDMANFKDFRKKYSEAISKPNKRTEMAIRHFEMAKNSGSYEEKIIDYVLALEALFSEGGGEITHKISQRVAIATSSNHHERLDGLKRMKKLYGLRSDIVHGRKVSVDYKDVRDCERFCRLSIHKILELHKSLKKKDDFIEVIDRILLGFSEEDAIEDILKN